MCEELLWQDLQTVESTPTPNAMALRTSRVFPICFGRLLAGRRAILHLLLGLLCLREQSLNLLLDRIQVRLQGGGCLFASLQFPERLGQ